jgi:predicted ATPase
MKLVENYFYEPLERKYFKNITNTTIIVVWRNKNKNRYLVHMRKKNISDGGGMWAFPGGMLEKTDKTLQEGALRETIEESQVKINSDILNWNKLKKYSKYLFPLREDSTNMTFFMIIKSTKKPKVLGPLKINKKPFLKSDMEVELTKKNSSGHLFLSSTKIYKLIKKKKFWKYSTEAYKKLYDILE